jgi:phthalate 4,5-cis-dihydrodiol dehydrogenase
MGARPNPARRGAARRELATAARAESAAKDARNYGGPQYPPPASGGAPAAHQHFGLVLVSCDHADLRPLPDGVVIYGDDDTRLEALPPPPVPRQEVIDELHAAVVHGAPPLHDGRWGMATLEVCLAILASAREGREVALAHQVRPGQP